MTQFERPFLCLFCDRFGGTVVDADPLKCLAFPDGIPQPILRSEADHRKPFDGDNGIRFNAYDTDTALRADEIMSPIFTAMGA